MDIKNQNLLLPHMQFQGLFLFCLLCFNFLKQAVFLIPNQSYNCKKLHSASLESGIQNCRINFNGVCARNKLINILNKRVHTNTFFY